MNVLVNVLMLVGGLVWLTGELIGVFTHGDTTSGWVWAAEKRWPWTRAIIAAFVANLGMHFQFHTPLFPGL